LEQEKLNLNAKTDHLRSMLEVGVYRVDPEWFLYDNYIYLIKLYPYFLYFYQKTHDFFKILLPKE
jgi:hypothetical protein